MSAAGFGFKNHWYALVLSEEVNGVTPYGLKLLGEPLVLYRDDLGVVHCYVDKCPHRSAKLSGGIIMDGKLECKYHGWQFGKDGECVKLPSVPPGTKLTSYCATSYATVEKWGLIWVFHGDQTLAQQTPLPAHLFAEFEDKAKYVTTHGFRDFDIDHGLMIENLLDPAHLPFTHVGTLAKREHAEEVSFTLLYDNLFDKEKFSEPTALFPAGVYGISGEIQPTTRPKQGFTFQVPCAVRVDLPTSRKKKLIQILFCIPITPTKMRLNYIFVRDFAMFLAQVPGSNRLFRYTSDKVTEQDLELLVGQQVNLQAGAKEFNTSVNADKLGVRYRRWRTISEGSENCWFAGFSEDKEIKDIEDLVGGVSIKGTPKHKQRSHLEILEAGGGGKDFKPRPRIPLFAPYVKWYALSVVGVVIISIFTFIKIR